MRATESLRANRLIVVPAIGLALATGRAGAAQVDANWVGGASNWNNVLSWSPNVIPNNGTGGNTYRVFIDHGAGPASTVTLDISPQIDTLTIDTGEILNFNNGTLLALAGGSITNNGTINLSSIGSNTDLRLDADLSLTGAGAVVMSNLSTNRIRSDVGTRRLTNASTIRGSGQIGVDSMALTNQGLIIADQPTTLSIDPSPTGAINTGTMRAASGGVLTLIAGSFDNTGGTIEALNGSSVSIAAAGVSGGTLTTAGTGAVNIFGSTLTGITNTGLINVPNGQLCALTGTITNNANVSLSSIGSNTDLRMDSDVSLTGGGTVNMGDLLTNRIRSDVPTRRLTNVNNTIRGSGQIGTDSMALTNQSLIVADQSTQLIIDPSASGVINTGTLRATAGATLNLSSGTFSNSGGVIQAQTGSVVSINSSLIDGGTITTVGSGVIRGTQSSFQDVTNTGTLELTNSALFALRNTMTNNATIQLSSIGSNTDLRVDTDVNLTGGGTVAMGDSGTNRIRSDTGTLRLTNVNNTIRGSGQIGTDSMALTNQSVIQADQGTPLTIDPSADGVINTGTLRATNNATLTLNGGNFFNTGGTIEAQTGSTVNVTFSLIEGGTLTSSGTGAIVGTQCTLKDLTSTGKVRVNNSTLIALNGASFNNLGTLDIESIGSNTDLRIDADLNLIGTGSINMSNNSSNRIYSNTATRRLTNVTNLIRGSGQIGLDSMALTNQAIIQADQPTALVIDPSSSGAINTGTMQAVSGGTLNLLGGSFDNTSGTIRAQNGSTVNLINSLVSNGILTTAGSGAINGNNCTLQNVTNNGNFVVPNAQLAALNGTTLTNTGTITINSTGSNTDLRLDANINLQGGGTVLLSAATPNRMYGNRLTNIDNTIRGSGQIGIDQMGLTNHAIVQADPGPALSIDPSVSGVINTGVMRAAAGGAVLGLNAGTFDNTGGVIEALNGSTVSVSTAVISGGVLTSSGTGAVAGFNFSTFANLTNTGQLVFSNGHVNLLQGTINNSGTMTLNSGGSNTDLRIDSNVDLIGSGTFTLTDASPNRIYGASNTFRLTNYSTIQGAGQIGVDGMALSNKGVMEANGNNILAIDVTDQTTFINEGTIRVTGPGGMSIANGGFTTSGTVTINASRSLSRSGDYPQTDGTTIVNGSLSATGGVSLTGGVLKGGGTVQATVTNTSGTVQPGTSVGGLTINGGYTQDTSAALSIELGGLTPVTQHDQLIVTGTANLGGLLRVDAVNGFTPALGQTFVILTCGTRNFAFNGIQVFNFPPGLTVTAQYNATNVTLQVVTGLGNNLGDLNCDNTRSVLDIPKFIEALLNPNAFNANNPACQQVIRADMNNDGLVNGRDVAVFTRCVTGGPCP